MIPYEEDKMIFSTLVQGYQIFIYIAFNGQISTMLLSVRNTWQVCIIKSLYFYSHHFSPYKFWFKVLIWNIFTNLDSKALFNGSARRKENESRKSDVNGTSDTKSEEFSNFQNKRDISTLGLYIVQSIFHFVLLFYYFAKTCFEDL